MAGSLHKPQIMMFPKGGRGQYLLFPPLNLQEGFVVVSHRLEPGGLKQKGDLLEGGADPPRRQVKLQNIVSSSEVQGTPATWLLTSRRGSWGELITASALPQITSLKIQKWERIQICPVGPVSVPAKAIVPNASGLCTFGGGRHSLKWYQGHWRKRGQHWTTMEVTAAISLCGAFWH